MDLEQPLKEMDARMTSSPDRVLELLGHYYALGWHVKIKLHVDEIKVGVPLGRNRASDGVNYELIAYKKVL